MEQTKQAAEAERLVQTYADMILRLCYTYLNNTQDAEDICQETFLKLLTAPRTFASREHEKAWVLRTAANACKDLLKSPRRSRTCSLEVCADLPTPAAQHSGVLDAVQSLDTPYRTVLYLHYYEGYSLKEIAQILDIPAATAGTRLRRGREKLKTILEEDSYEICV